MTGDRVRTPETGGAAGNVARTILMVSFVDALGSGIFLASAPILAVSALGHPAPLVGVALGLVGLAGLASSVPVGRFSDRHSPRATLLAIHVSRGVVVAGFGFAESTPVFLVLLTALGVAEGGVSPLTQGLVAHHMPETDRVRRMAQIRATRNTGFCVGSLIAAAVLLLAPQPAAIAVGLLDGLSFLLSAALLLRVPPWVTGSRSKSTETAGLPAKSREHTRRTITTAGVLSGVLSLHAAVLTVALPLWVTQVAHLPASLAPIAIAANAVLVIAFQVKVSDRLQHHPPRVGAFGVAAVALTAGLVLFMLPAQLPAAALVAAAAASLLALTAAEMVHSVAAWDAGFALSSERDRATDLARFNLGVLGQEIAAPLLLTSLLAWARPGPWIVLGIAVLVCGAAANRLMSTISTRRIHESI